MIGAKKKLLPEREAWPNAVLPSWMIIAMWRAKKVAWGFLSDLFSPLRDIQQQLGVILSLVAAYLAIKSDGLSGALDQIRSFDLWLGTLLTAIPIWCALNLVRSPFKVMAEERKLGHFDGREFVYSEPLLVGTVRWRPADNGTFKTIRVEHPQSASFAMVSTEFYPSNDKLRAGISWSPSPQFPLMLMTAGNETGISGVRINKGRLFVVGQSAPDIGPVTIRVYAHSFEVGPT